MVAAVVNAGGLGFVAAGYLSALDLHKQIAAVRDRTSGPFGVNLFVPWPNRVDAAALDAYAENLEPDARRLKTALGEPRWDNDAWPAKVDLLLADPLPLATLLAVVRAGTDLPLVAAGGIATADDVREVLAAGATWAQVGTALLRSPESGVSRIHQDALADATRTTTLTRAFTGRRARGLVNAFIRDHAADEIEAYPQVHYLHRGIRAQ